MTDVERSGRTRPGGPRRSLSIVMSADVQGPSLYHVGDEAIAAANVEWIRAAFPAARLTVFSEDPAFTAGEYGVESLAEPAGSPDRPLRQAVAVAAARAFDRARPAGGAAAARRAVRAAAVFWIGGGGNLCRMYRNVLARHTFLARVALDAGVPVVMTGQQIGPELDRRDERMLAPVLRGARFVGVRDRDSAAAARRLGAAPERVLLAPDDAFALAGRLPPAARIPAALREERAGRTIGLSLHRHRGLAMPYDEFVRRLAAALTALRAASGASVVFLPHMFRAGGASHDAELVHALRRACPAAGEGEIVDGLVTAREMRALTERCAFVVSTRYHDLVFALAAGVPFAGIAQGDAYTSSKLSAVTGWAGLPPRWRDVGADDLPEFLAAAWRGRKEARRDLEAGRARAGRAYEAGRAALAAALAPFLGPPAA